ncbi:MAG: insulinase family protein [Oscillospiraceae bacterium]|nr:insulinase family protein [Oscillospiraceae bacterium]
MTNITLAPSVNLTIIPDKRFTTNTIALNFISPTNSDKNTLLALLGCVLRRGCAEYPTIRDIQRSLDELYAAEITTTIDAIGTTNLLSFRCSWLSDAYAISDEDITGGTLDMLGKLLFSPVLENGLLSAKYVDSEKQNLIDEINAMSNDKDNLAARRTVAEACAGHPAGVPLTGTVEQAESATVEELTAYYHETLNTHPIEIFYTGALPADTIEKYLRRTLAPLLSLTQRALLPAHTHLPPAEYKEIEEVHHTSQGKLGLAFSFPTSLSEYPYQPKLALFHEILSGSPVNRLFYNVREKHSLCYYCNASIESKIGLMTIMTGIEVARRTEAERVIIHQITDMAAGNVSDDELATAKLSLSSGYRKISDRPDGLQAWYLRRRLSGEVISPIEAEKRIQSVTTEDIANVAKQMTHRLSYFMKGGE